MDTRRGLDATECLKVHIVQVKLILVETMKISSPPWTNEQLLTLMSTSESAPSEIVDFCPRKPEFSRKLEFSRDNFNDIGILVKVAKLVFEY
jgi:hypothetical protein